MRFLLTFLSVVLFTTAQGQDTIRWISKDLKKWTRESTNPYLFNCLGSSIERKLYIVVERYHGDTLISQEETFNETCKVGTSKTFYKNAQLKQETSYLLQPENPKELTLCDIKDGKQLELSQNGDTLIYENWHNGNFEREIKQQDSSTVWKFDHTLTSSSIPIESIKKDKPFEIKLELNYRKNGKPKTQTQIEVFYIIGKRLVWSKTFHLTENKLVIDHSNISFPFYQPTEGRLFVGLREGGKRTKYFNIKITE